MRDEVERYGHYSLAAESKYDHPFQWGSKRTGPDLARVVAVIQMTGMWTTCVIRKRLLPESVMPKYGFLEHRMVEGEYIGDIMRANAFVGVPYTEDMIENAQSDFLAQADPDSDYEVSWSGMAKTA